MTMSDDPHPTGVLNRPDDGHLNEADHRISNSLALIAAIVRNQAREVAGAKVVSGQQAADMLGDTASRIELVSRLHRMLSGHGSTQMIDTAYYLRRICEAASRLHESRAAQMRFAYELADCFFVDAKQMGPMGLLANEAITNAIKHAHPAGAPGVVSVTCQRAGTRGVLSVRDDGVGLPPGFDPQRDGGSGFKIMRRLAEQLNAKLSFKSEPLGLTVHAVVPL